MLEWGHMMGCDQTLPACLFICPPLGLVTLRCNRSLGWGLQGRWEAGFKIQVSMEIRRTPAPRSTSPFGLCYNRTRRHRPQECRYPSGDHVWGLEFYEQAAECSNWNEGGYQLISIRPQRERSLGGGGRQVHSCYAGSTIKQIVNAQHHSADALDLPSGLTEGESPPRLHIR